MPKGGKTHGEPAAFENFSMQITLVPSSSIEIISNMLVYAHIIECLLLEQARPGAHGFVFSSVTLHSAP